MAEATFAFDLHVLSTPPAFNLSQNQTLQFKSVQRFLLGRNQNLKVLFPLALHLSMNQKKSFSLPPFFAAFVNMLFCHRFVNNFFGNLQKTFCEGFLKPRCFRRRGRLLRSSLMPVNSFFSFPRKSSSRNLQRKAVFQAANATSTLPRQECQSFSQKIFQEHVFSFRLSSAHMDSPSKISACCAVFPLSVQRLSTSLRHFIDRRTVSVLRFFPLFCAAGLSFSL